MHGTTPRDVAKMLGGAPTHNLDNLQTRFDAAMAGFLQERQITQTHLYQGVARGKQESRMKTARNGPDLGVQVSMQHTISDLGMESVGL